MRSPAQAAQTPNPLISIGSHVRSSTLDLPLPAVQCHSFPAVSPGVRGCGALGHGQPFFGPV